MKASLLSPGFRVLVLALALPFALTSPANVVGSASFSGTGDSLPSSFEGVAVTNATGHVSLLGSVRVLRIRTDDPRLDGRLRATLNLVYQDDGVAWIQGAALQEVGTWDTADPVGLRFGPSGGAWELRCQGVIQPDGSSELILSGYGIGGSIDGWRLKESFTRGAGGAPFDLSVPYTLVASLEPPTVNTVEVVDDFDDDTLHPKWSWRSSNSMGHVQEANGRLAVHGFWPGIRTLSPFHTWAKAFAYSKPWALSNGQTVELRVDLVSASPSASIVDPALAAYAMMCGRGFVCIGKFVFGDWAILSADPVVLAGSNLVLSLALTRVQTNLWVTARVLDPADRRVVFERTVVDSPQADPTLTNPEIEAVTAMNFPAYTFAKDIKAAPLFVGDYLNLEIVQYSPKGALPEAIAVFDNLELHKYDSPPVSISRGTVLSWPGVADGFDFEIQAARNPEGPWVTMPASPNPGMRQVGVPATETQRFFRLR